MTKFRNLKTLNQVCFEQKAEAPINLYYWLIIKIFVSRIIFIIYLVTNYNNFGPVKQCSHFQKLLNHGQFVYQCTSKHKKFKLILYYTMCNCSIVYSVFNQSQMFNCLHCFQPITNVQLFNVFSTNHKCAIVYSVSTNHRCSIVLQYFQLVTTV